MNENEAARIAAAINCLRPDWPTASIETLLTTRMLNRSRRDAAVALAWVACESKSSTPARVLEAGPWWKAANIETPELGGRRPPTPEQECRTHPGNYADHCGGCYADQRAARDEADAQRGRTARETAMTRLRQARIAAAATLCDHHLNADTCVICRKEQARTPACVPPGVPGGAGEETA